MADKHDTKPYENPQAVELLIDAMQSVSGKKFTDDEKKLLSNNPALAERVFEGDLKNAIIKDRVSITELSKMSQDAVAALTYGRISTALEDGTLKASQIAALDDKKLKEFIDLSQGVTSKGSDKGDKNFKKLVEILGIKEDQGKALRDSFESFDSKKSQNPPMSPDMPSQAGLPKSVIKPTQSLPPFI